MLILCKNCATLSTLQSIFFESPWKFNYFTEIRHIFRHYIFITAYGTIFYVFNKIFTYFIMIFTRIFAEQKDCFANFVKWQQTNYVPACNPYKWWLYIPCMNQDFANFIQWSKKLCNCFCLLFKRLAQMHKSIIKEILIFCAYFLNKIRVKCRYWVSTFLTVLARRRLKTNSDSSKNNDN